MNDKNKISGFLLKEKRNIDELSCSVYEYEHEKTGAVLVYLDREDENKTFAIGFKTLPEDSTGVFHIIEHSVLCGSEKFPVKEPFVELLKSSLNTFLNALTYPDMTVYPVASRCERDFLNLAEVYLDAVFFPLMKTDKRIFMQEGVHLEYDKDSDSLSFKGVVYNEMKGAYSAPEEAGFPELDALLFEGSPYGFDSGGCPDNIPDLTYEKFVSMHDKYYHPSNAVVVLDGRQNIEKSLALIDSYFSRFSYKNIGICKSNITKSIKPMREVCYDATEDGEDSKMRLLVASTFAEGGDRCARLASDIISDILVGNNDSPLKHALISRGLCEDVNMNISETELCALTVEYRGVKREDLAEIERVTREVALKTCEDGVPREKINASLNMLEFKAREADYGTRPRGVVLALAAIKNMLRGFSPDEGMAVIPLYSRLRELTEGDYYEELLRRMMIEVDHTASVLVIPSDSFGEEVAHRERQRLDAIRKTLDGKAVADLIADNESLRERQEGEDSPEALSTLPRLTLDDLPRGRNSVECEMGSVMGVKTISPKAKTGGIVYLKLDFDLSDLTPCELTLATIISGLYLSLPTENYSLTALTDEIRMSLGELSVSVRKISLINETDRAIPTLSVNAAALSERYGEIPRLVSEVLLRSCFDDKERIKTHLKQAIMYAEEAFVSGGETLALDTAATLICSAGAIDDNITGYTSYLRMKELLQRLNTDADAALCEILRLSERIISKDRLTVTVLGTDTATLAEAIVRDLPSGKMGEPYRYLPYKERNIGYAIPGRVSYAVSGAFSEKTRDMLGTLRIARHILSYEYLWNAVRVQGGAYGAGFITRKSGEILYYSYRDPSPGRSLECYKNAPAALRAIASSGMDLTDYIIGAVGEYDILLSPRLGAMIAADRVLAGWSAEDEDKLWRDMISTDSDALLRVADLLEALSQAAVQVVAGPESRLAEIDGVRDNIRRI